RDEAGTGARERGGRRLGAERRRRGRAASAPLTLVSSPASPMSLRLAGRRQARDSGRRAARLGQCSEMTLSGQLGVGRLLLSLLGLPLLFQRPFSRLLFHALLRVLVLGHVPTSYVRRGSAGRIVAVPSSSTSTT